MARGSRASEGRGRLAESEAGDRLRAQAQERYQKGMEELKAQLERGLEYAGQQDIADDKQDAKVAKAQKEFYAYRGGLGSDGLRDDVAEVGGSSEAIMDKANQAFREIDELWYNSPEGRKPTKSDGTPFTSNREWRNSPEHDRMIGVAGRDLRMKNAELTANAEEMIKRSGDLLAAKFGVDKKSGLSLIGFEPGFYSNQSGRRAGFGEIIGRIAKAKADGKPYDNAVILAAKAFLAGQKVLYANKSSLASERLSRTYEPAPAKRGQTNWHHTNLYREQGKFYKSRDSYRAVREMEEALNKAIA